jgi:hypothetical protein
VALEYPGQYWNAKRAEVQLTGKGGSEVYDLSPFLPYPPIRTGIKNHLGGNQLGNATNLPLLMESLPFPTVQAIMEAENAGDRLLKLSRM